MPNASTAVVSPLSSASPSAKPARLGDSLVSQLGALLSKALDAAALEVRTYTSDAADASLSSNDDPLEANTRLRAFTRVAVDGHTETCVPLRANGEPDEALTRLHHEVVEQARQDRARIIGQVIALVKELSGR